MWSRRSVFDPRDRTTQPFAVEVIEYKVPQMLPKTRLTIKQYHVGPHVGLRPISFLSFQGHATSSLRLVVRYRRKRGGITGGMLLFYVYHRLVVVMVLLPRVSAEG